MFPAELHKDRLKDFHYHTTDKSPDDTLFEIQKLLRQKGCERVMTDYNQIDGHEHLSIYFSFQKKPYMLTIPRCYVRGKYLEKIGVRTVFYFIKNLLQLVDQGVSLENLLLPARMIRDPDTDMPTTLGNKADEIIAHHKIELLGPGGQV